MSLKYSILDSDELVVEQLKSHLEKRSNWQFASNDSLENNIQTIVHDATFDVIFLSPNFEGFNWKELDFNACQSLIVLIGHPGESGSEAFEKGVFNFVNNPISSDDILRVANKVEQLLLSDIGGGKHETEPFIFVKSDYKIIRIKINDIQFIESMREYVKIHLNDQKIITLLSLSRLDEILPKHSFMRVHRSTIVNIEKINFIQGNVISIGSHQISISKSQKDTIMEYVNRYGLF